MSGTNDNMTVPINYDFCEVITCAVRYALGRRTYLSKAVVDYLTPLLPKLKTVTIYTLIEDISRAKEFGCLGDPIIDAQLWYKLLDDAIAERARRWSNE
jgi:hypothetical protein